MRYLENRGGYPTADAVLAAATTTLAWGPLMRKRVSRLTVESLPWWVRLFGTLIGASVPAERHKPDRFCGMPNEEILATRSLTEVACAALLGEAAPTSSHLFVFQTLVGLLPSNGPGTISAQGAKGAVAADGPESPERVQLNKAVIGFLSHTGFAHGGNGYEGIAFLVDQFRDSGLSDPGDPEHGIIVGSIFGMDRQVLIKGFLKIFVPLAAGSVVRRDRRHTHWRGARARRLHTFFYVVIPIMAGGVGEGAIPLSIGYAEILRQQQGTLFPQILPPILLGSLTAILLAGFLNWSAKGRRV